MRISFYTCVRKKKMWCLFCSLSILCVHLRTCRCWCIVVSHTVVRLELDRAFVAARSVLLTSESWCLPPGSRRRSSRAWCCRYLRAKMASPIPGISWQQDLKICHFAVLYIVKRCTCMMYVGAYWSSSRSRFTKFDGFDGRDFVSW